jgi:hypothetical protein
MKTALIDGQQPSRLDGPLLNTIHLCGAEPRSVWSESMLIGIQNEQGELYRAIGVTGLTNFVSAIQELHSVGYTYRLATIEETLHGFDAIVSEPATIE